MTSTKIPSCPELRDFYNTEIRALGDPAFDVLPPDQVTALEELYSFKRFVFRRRFDHLIASVLHALGFHDWSRPEIDKAEGQYKRVKKCSHCGVRKIVGILAALIITFASCAPGNNFKGHYNYDPARTTGRRIISEEEVSGKIVQFMTEYHRLEDSLLITEKGTIAGVRIVVRQIKLLDSVEKYNAMRARPSPVPDSASVNRLNNKGIL